MICLPPHPSEHPMTVDFVLEMVILQAKKQGIYHHLKSRMLVLRAWASTFAYWAQVHGKGRLDTIWSGNAI